MEYKHLLDVCEQLLKYSALPIDMLEKYYLLKEKTLLHQIQIPQNNNLALSNKIISLFGQCFNSMLTQKDINITNTENQINYVLDTFNAMDLRSDLQKAFQQLLQINVERKELDATVSFLQNEVKKLKLEINIHNSKQEQQKKLQQSEEKDKHYKLQKKIQQLEDDLQTQLEEHEEQIRNIQFKYEEQLKTLSKRNIQESQILDSQQELKSYEKFFDQFAELSLPYLEKYEKDFEKFQMANKKYNNQISEKEVLLDFLFYLLQKYVPLQDLNQSQQSIKKNSGKKSHQSSPKPQLHFDQYKATNLEDNYSKLKQELEDSRKALERYETSKQKLQSQII